MLILVLQKLLIREISTGSPVPSSITYEITMSSIVTMTVEIDYATGWWKFVYQKTSLSVAPPPSNYNVILTYLQI